jgi:hypothetical protein
MHSINKIGNRQTLSHPYDPDVAPVSGKWVAKQCGDFSQFHVSPITGSFVAQRPKDLSALSTRQQFFIDMHAIIMISF